MAKDLPDFVQELLPSFFELYPRMGPSNPSSWIVWSNDKVKYAFMDICHADMVYYSSGWKNLITAIPNDDDISLAYQRMLINGPFRGFSDLIHLEKDETSGKYFAMCSDLDRWPANVLFNYCIATRFPLEKPGLTKDFGKLLEKGYDPTLSALLAWSAHYPTYAWMPKREKGERGFYTWGHYWHDSNADWRRILSGDMTLMSVSYRENPRQCCPSNVIWGESEDHRILRFMSDEEIANHFDMKPVVVKPPKKKKAKAPQGDPGQVYQYMQQLLIQPQDWPPPQPVGDIVNNAMDQLVQQLHQEEEQFIGMNDPNED